MIQTQTYLSKKIAIFIFILAVIGHTVGVAQTAKPETYKILSINVEGNKTAETGAVIANSGLRIGDEISIPSDQTRQAVQRLWSLRIFSDIQLLIENKIGSGVYLLIKVAEYPRLERLDFTGNDEFSTDELKKKIVLLRGQVVHPEAIAEAIQTLKKDYFDKGYLLVTIKAEQTEEPAGSGRIVVNFVIDEGNVVKVEHIEFVGNTVFPSETLKGEMDETIERKWWRFWRSAKFDPKKFPDDLEKVKKFYQRNGYRDAEVMPDTTIPDSSKKYLTVRIKVYEGVKYYIRSIAWQGVTIYPAQILNERLGLKPGDVYNVEKFDQNLRGNEAQTDVASLYLDNGYLTVNMDPEEVRVGKDSVDLVIHVVERNQFRIGRIAIKGNTKTNEKVIRRELFTIPGNFFSRQEIMRSLRQLNVLNYFNPEKLKPDYQIANDSTVALSYEVEEKSSDTFNASVGYSAIYSFVGSIGLTFNNFSLSDPLAGGAGQILSFDWQFGEANRYRTLALSFTEPWFMDTPTTIGVSISDTRQNYYGDYTLTGASLHLGRRFRWPDDYFRGDVSFNYKKMDVISAPLLYDQGKSDQFSLGLVLSRSTIDNPQLTTRGTSVAFAIEWSGGPLLPGTVNYQKYGLNIDWYTPLSEHFTLYTGSQIGAVFGWGNELYIQWPDRYFMGGTGLGYISTTPLRGYDDRVIGPMDSTGTPVGGRALAKYTAELRFNVSQNPIPIYLLAFLDAGNVWADWSRMSMFDLKRSAGVGARLMINPIGMVGFDYGYGYDSPVPGGAPSGWKLHFQFGRGM